jgi:hypothetical protein
VSVRWARQAVALAVPALLLCGCAQQVVSVDPSRPRAPAVSTPAPAFSAPARPGFVIAASHATTDPSTRDLAAELARRTGFALVVTPGLAVDPERVREAARGPLTFYAELRGGDAREPANLMAIATVGIDDGLAARLRALYELIRNAYVRGHPGTPVVDVLFEPAREGIGRPPTRALHLELPRIARGEARESYTAILADFLAEAATLPAGR